MLTAWESLLTTQIFLYQSLNNVHWCSLLTFWLIVAPKRYLINTGWWLNKNSHNAYNSIIFCVAILFFQPYRALVKLKLKQSVTWGHKAVVESVLLWKIGSQQKMRLWVASLERWVCAPSHEAFHILYCPYFESIQIWYYAPRMLLFVISKCRRKLVFWNERTTVEMITAYRKWLSCGWETN